MSSMVVWMLTLALSLGAISISAAAGRPEVHLAMSAFVSLTIAIIAVRENRQLIASNASRSTIAASTARYLGLIWVWGALGLLMTYFVVFPTWREWWHFCLAFATAGVLSLFFAATLGRDAEKGQDDETMLRLGRALITGQFIGMAITMLGLAIDPDKSFFNTKRPDWAANSIFFFGALSLAAISLNSILGERAALKKA